MGFIFILLLLPHLVCNASAEFIGLPDFVSVLEDVRPRNVLVEFQVRNFSVKPDIHIFSVTPYYEDLLEAPVVTPAAASGTFDVQIIQNGSLDYERVSLYTVCLQLVNATGFTNEQTFHIRVGDVNEPPQCDPLFQLTGATVHVPEDFPAPVSIYTILASDPDHNDTISFSISQVRPESSSGRFHIDGGKLTSSEPFDYHNGPKKFEVDVAVRDRHGANCTGTVRIEVLKVYNRPLYFVHPFQRVSIYENQGPESFVAAVKVNVSFSDVRYTFVSDYPPFKIRAEDGVIRTAYNLDLETEGALLAHSVLLVRAYSLAEERTGTATVNVTVLDVNEYPPFCSPPVIVLVVPETTPVGSNLGTLTCLDMDFSDNTVSVSMIDNGLPFIKFRLEDGQLQVNNTLDYDTVEMASNGFQYEDTILAIDAGTPPRTSQIRVLVTVTPVNEHKPVFIPATLVLPIREDTRPGSAVGVVVATDQDWPFDNIRYSILSKNSMFTVDPDTGQLYLNTELDFELQQTHVVRLQAEDYDQDVDKTNRKTALADLIVHVENVNDNAPVCDPVAYESTIFSTRSERLAILQLSCTDADGDDLTATITNGAAVDRFRIDGDLNLFSKNVFSYVVDGVYDRTMFEVTFSVSDRDDKHRTTAVAYIYVVPWTTTTPTTTTTTTTKAPQVVTVRSDYWDPDPFFVVMMTVTGGLVLAALGLITWAILKRKYGWGKKDPAKEPLTSNTDGSNKKDTLGDKHENDQYSLDGAVSLSKVSLQDELMRFDGKAQDPMMVLFQGEVTCSIPPLANGAGFERIAVDSILHKLTYI